MALVLGPADLNQKPLEEDPQLQEEMPEEAGIPEETLSDEEIDELLMILVKKAEDQDLDLRYNLINIARRNELYFKSIQSIVLDPVAQDYRTIDSVLEEMKRGLNTYDVKINNIYRATAETITAALSVELPSVDFAPDDSEDPDDLEAADAYKKIAAFLQKHGKASLKLIKLLITLYNQGVAFGYSKYKEDDTQGIIKKPLKVNGKLIKENNLVCSKCGTIIESSIPADVQIVPETSSLSCEDCGYHGPPVVVPKEDYVDEVTDYEETPKGVSEFEIYGYTRVKVPLYAKSQSEVDYLILRDEAPLSRLRAKWGDFTITDNASDVQKYERWGRLPVEYRGSVPKGIATERIAWLQPSFFAEFEEEEKVKALTEKFPRGVKVTIIGDYICERVSEKLDSHWTITFDPKEDFIHAEAAGNVMIPIQDVENDVFNLGVQTLMYGIPETFVHPRTINLNKYGQSPSSPGMMTAAMPPGPDKNLSDGFFSVKAATLSNEYTTFEQSIVSKGQFASGALPSIFGGNNPKGSQTASEFTQSRSNALQRLQIPYRVIKVFWSEMIYKTTRNYVENMKEDLRYPDKDKSGRWISVWVHKTSLKGKVGHIEPDMNEQLPQSWTAKREFIMRLIELNSPQVGAILLHPNNSQVIKDFSGIGDLYIPGEYDRSKQWNEYYRLSMEAPLNEIMPSVEVDIDVDDHKVHMEVLKNILISPLGLELKNTNPAGYMNSILHYRMHDMAFKAKTMAGIPGAPPNVEPPSASQSIEG